MALHISISAEPIFSLGKTQITNSILTTWLVAAFIIFLSIKSYLHFKKVTFKDKPGVFQSFMEIIVESLYDLVHGITGSHQKARSFFPVIASFFLFILFSNWSGLLPGVGQIGFSEEVSAQEVSHTKPEPATETVSPQAEEHSTTTEVPSTASDQLASTSSDSTTDTQTVETSTESHPTESTSHTKFIPFFRAPTADINTTLALALFSVAFIQYVGLKFSGLKYLTKFFNFTGPIQFFVGILELVAEFSKIISFAFRLFGNIFAGEVLLSVIAFLLPIIAPMPFLGLEIFFGFIQALVFAMLSVVFFNIATEHHE